MFVLWVWDLGNITYSNSVWKIKMTLKHFSLFTTSGDPDNDNECSSSGKTSLESLPTRTYPNLTVSNAIFALSHTATAQLPLACSPPAYVFLASLPFHFQLVFSFHATTVTKVIPFAAQRTELNVRKLYLWVSACGWAGPSTRIPFRTNWDLTIALTLSLHLLSMTLRSTSYSSAPYMEQQQDPLSLPLGMKKNPEPQLLSPRSTSAPKRQWYCPPN